METAVTGGQVPDASQSADEGSLPFTGVALLPWLAIACGLLASGLLVRRLTSSTGAAVEPAGEARPLAVPPAASTPKRTPPSRGAIVMSWLALVVYGLLLHLRKCRGLGPRGR